MYPPPQTDDIDELRKWCDDFYVWFMTLGQKIGGWENIESDEQASVTWTQVSDEFANGILRRQD